MAKTFDFVKPRGLTSPLTEIVVAPDPRLRVSPPNVTKFDDELRATVEAMKSFMLELGAVGLAANQVGINKRIAIVSDGAERIFAIINPWLVSGWGDRMVPEGCLSLPGIEILKRRPEVIYVVHTDENGVDEEDFYDGFLAQVMCHEIDHLDGRLMTDEDDRKWHEIHGGV